MGKSGTVRQAQDFFDQTIQFVDADGLDNALKPKFSLIKAIKTTIPKGYQHLGYLDRFYKNNRDYFYFYNKNITDEKLGTVSHQLIPGKNYLVKTWLINKNMCVNFADVLTLLKAQGAYLTGTHGITLLWQELRNQLPRDRWYVSFDKKENLPSTNGDVLVPGIICDASGAFGFGLGSVERGWFGDGCVIGFCDHE